MGIETLIIQAVIFAATTYLQKQKQKKQKKKQAAASEARKGFEFTIVGEASPVPIVYGKNLLGGIAVKHHMSSSFTTGSLGAATHFVENLDHTTTVGGTKNEYLHAQYAICQEGIEGVQGVKVNDLDFDAADQLFSHSIRTYADGGTADAIATANGIVSTNRFTGTAYASATFKLNRNDPQYNGAPGLGFIVKGRKVRAVELNTGVYSLSTSYVYSNNPALCLLDYMLNADFGRGITTDELDLQSFYDAAVVCGTTVSSGRAITGVVNGGVGTRDIPLYECNLTLSPSDTIRDNIESIMDTMALADLTWTSEGKYKLLVEYPTSEAEQDALVDAGHYFTDDDIIRDELTQTWPSASDRLNQATVTFLNEHEDFKSDSMTWPTTGDAAHTTFLAEDNSQPFVGSATLDGVTDPYHALAAAEQMVRQSRSTITLSMTVTKKGLSLEPGDFINVTAANSGLSDEVYRVESIEVMEDFTVKLSCYFFDFNTLAWNVNDDIAYSVRPTFDFVVDPVTSLVYTAGRPDADTTAIAALTWTSPDDGSYKAVVSYTDDAGDLQKLGETSNSSFVIYPRTEWTNGESVTFTVQSKTPLGRRSTGVTVVAAVTRAPSPPNSFSVTETLYQTNKAAGVKARATLNWSEPVGGVEPKDYKVRAYRDEDGSTYKLLGYTVGDEYVIEDIRAGDYHFEVVAISHFGHASTALIGTKTILGLSAIPADPTGFVGKAADASILLTWDTPVDLDVVSGGTTEVRFARDDGGTPKWELSQTLVNNIGGSTTTATLPLAAGYYLIKHLDSSGNECADPAQLLNTFVGPDFNAVTTLTEDPTFTGAKTNCTVVSSVLTLDALATSMTYVFGNSLDLGSVESVRLAPSLTAVITDGTTTVADYDPVSAVTRLSGPLVDAALSFEVRHTDDDPAGSPTWSDWETFTVGSFRHRGFEFRIQGVVAAAAYTVEISALSLLADKADVQKRGTSTSSASVDTTVTFATAFYGGIGDTDLPYVGFSVIGGSAGDSVDIVSITKSAFVYSVYNAGSRVVRSITWQAVGQ